MAGDGTQAHRGEIDEPGLTPAIYNRMVVPMQVMPLQPAAIDRVLGALADATRRDILRRAMSGTEGVAELASHYPMSFAAVQKHVAVLERAGLLSKRRSGREQLASGEVEAIRSVTALLRELEDVWRGRIGRIEELLADTDQGTAHTEKET